VLGCTNSKCRHAKINDDSFKSITCIASSYDDYLKCRQAVMREQELDRQVLTESKFYFDLYARLA
jgi:hypothetical protein